MSEKNTILQFAKAHRLKTRLDVDGTTIIPGRKSEESHIFDDDDGSLGVMFCTPAPRPPRTAFWNRRKAECLAAGMALRQSGDAEGTFAFNPHDPEQARLAIKLAGCRPKRRVSEEQRAAMVHRLAQNRQKAAEESVLATLKASVTYQPYQRVKKRSAPCFIGCCARITVVS